jgi:hypothetical protein
MPREERQRFTSFGSFVGSPDGDAQFGAQGMSSW